MSGILWPNVVAFMIGVLSSVAANWLASSAIFTRGRRLSILGTWGEYVVESINHQYSLGMIYYDRRKAMYRFDGTNFRNNGERYCHWETVTSYIDADARRFFYIFSAQLEGELDKTFYGFGVLNLAIESGRIIPVDGHYASTNVQDKILSHSMFRMDQFVYNRSEGGSKIIRAIESIRKLRSH